MSGIYRGVNGSATANALNIDGDKGDLTISSSGSDWTINPDTVTFAKMQNISTDTVLGRATAGSGDVEEISCTAAGRALLDDANAAAQRTTLGVVPGSDVLAYDANLQSFVNTFTLPTADGSSGFILTTNGTGTLSLSAPPPLADKDYGDITVSGAGSTLTIDAGVVTTTKLGGDITVAGKALLDDADASAQRTTLGLGTVATQGDGDKGDITVSASGATWTIDNETVTLEKLAPSAKTDKIQPITASVASNALTITLNPTTLDFRDATLTSGTVNTRKIPVAISVVVSSGSTLGTINAVLNRLAVLAIDNAGTVELAVVNVSGGVNLDETGVISTTAEGGAGAADSATVIYSTTARTNVPYRVVGFVESTQATAGTWATAPSKIQGYGGQAFSTLSGVGYSQTWQDVSSSRAVGVTYYNTTGKPILVAATFTNGTANSVMGLTINGVSVAAGSNNNASGAGGFCLMIPPSFSYTTYTNVGSLTLVTWRELI